MANFYQLLNLHPEATAEEIQDAYNRQRAELLAAEDANPKQATEQLQAVDEAFATLSDLGRRMAYDRTLGTSSSSSALTLTQQTSALAVAQPVTIVQQPCPHCGSLNPVQATACKACGQQVSRACPNCGQAVVLGQTVCGRCNTFLPEYDQRRFAEVVATEQTIAKERRQAEARVAVLETTHTANRRMGLVFWLVVLTLCIGLTILAVVLSTYFEQAF